MDTTGTRRPCRANVRATFFVAAPLALEYPRIVATTLEAGHGIESHCTEHVRHTHRSCRGVEADTREGLRLLWSLGVVPRLWHPPWGVYAPRTEEATASFGLQRRNRAVVETEAGRVPYNSLVLATNSEPFRILVPGAGDPEIMVMRTIENSERLKSRVDEGSQAVVVGSGFIGCEAAASLSIRGARVTRIRLENSPREERLGVDVGRRIEGWLEAYSVDLRSGAGIARPSPRPASARAQPSRFRSRTSARPYTRS